MMTIRQLANRFGLSRTTLLYYDRIGLLHPSARSEAGYRLYDADAAARLADICVYRNAGLSLDAVAQLLDSPQTDETSILTARMRELDAEIAQLRIQQQAIAALIAGSDGHPAAAPFDKKAWVDVLAAAGLDADQRERWHQAFEANAPDAHHAFLRWLGINEAEIAALRRTARQPAHASGKTDRQQHEKS